MQHDSQRTQAGNSLRMISRFVFFGFVAVAGFFLITEHRAHLFGWLPFLLLAACPLMHFFHHGGHGGHGGGDKESPPGTGTGPNEPAAGDRGGHRH